MNTFPTLSTGSVTQYPAPMITAQGVQALRFLDGTDQRYLTQGRTFRSWQIRLDLLTEAEISLLESFFAQQAGDYLPFNFPDPFSGSAVPNCRFGAPSLITEYNDVDSGSVTLWVIETNG